MEPLWVLHNLTVIFRTLNLTLAIVCLVWLLVRRIKDSNLYAGRLRNDIWLLALYWTAASIDGTIEQLFRTGTTTRVVLATAALLVTLRLLLHDKTWYEIRDERYCCRHEHDND